MKYYLAPMEGVTGYQYRMAYHEIYRDADRYFTPFLVGKNLSAREKAEVDWTHNAGMHLIPQILTNHADEFVYLANNLKRRYGYEEVNLNLGCPSGTVASKNRGSGFLRVLDELEQFLDYIYANSEVRISIKTRIGVEDSTDWERILKLYRKYLMSELIIHPRTQKQGYGGIPQLQAFEDAYNFMCEGGSLVVPMIYNGNVNTVNDRDWIVKQYPLVDGIMCGRGLITDPALLERLMDTPVKEPVTSELTDLRQLFYEQLAGKWDETEIQKLRQFMKSLFQTYKQGNLSEKNMLFKVKELWSYWYRLFPEPDAVLREVQKSTTATAYEAAVNNAFRRLRSINKK